MSAPRDGTAWMRKPVEMWDRGDELDEAAYRVNSLSEQFDNAPTALNAIMLGWWERELDRLVFDTRRVP